MADIPQLPITDTPLHPLHFAGVSGLYTLMQRIIPFPPIPLPHVPPVPGPGPGPIGPGPGPGPVQAAPAAPEAGGAEAASPALSIIRLGYGAELRLDVDGWYPQQVASGVLWSGMSATASWVAHIAPTGPLTWSGSIFYKTGNTAVLPFTAVTITVHRASLFMSPTSATLVFSGGGATGLSLDLQYRSPSFHDVQMEFDAATGTTGVTDYATCAHPNRPATLPCETLTIETVFRRAGFNVTKSGGDSIVPLSGAGSDQRWSIAEMNDAMETYWSKYANVPQWSLWVLFASLSDQGSSLGGIMFDYAGEPQRQGCAIFEDAFISQAPAGDPDPTDWVHRMRFWTACHETGHTFNLAHSWQESATSGGHGPWVPLADEPEGRTFMNYPYNVAGGTSAFFGNFFYRFSDQELVFLRHAPAAFVEQGNADWFDQHGFQRASLSAEPSLALEVRAHRGSMAYSYMEPVYVELKLSNVSAAPVIVDAHTLLDQDALAIVVKRQGDRARMRVPHARFCMERVPRVLQPGEALYESVLVSIARDGWEIAEPGRYVVQAALRLPGGDDIVSNALTLRVERPDDRDQERLADDFFDVDTARIFASGGTRVKTSVNRVLETVSERLPDHPVSRHARLLLGRPYATTYKVIEFADAATAAPTSVAGGGGRITVLEPDLGLAAQQLGAALADHDAAADTFGHIRYRRAAERLADVLERDGATDGAMRVLDDAGTVLAKRGALASVVADLQSLKNEVAVRGGRTQAAR